MGSLSNSIILSFLCSNISSTEAPGIESSGSKENSHHAQIKVSSMISRHEHFSVKHVLSAGGVHCNTGQRGVAMHKEDCIVVLVKPVVEVMAATAPNPPRLCNRHLQKMPLGQQAFCLKSLVSVMYWYHLLQRVPKKSSSKRVSRRPQVEMENHRLRSRELILWRQHPRDKAKAQSPSRLYQHLCENSHTPLNMGGRIIPNTFLQVTSQGEEINSFK